MKNWLKTGVAILFLGLTSIAHAVGMGEIVMESGLNEPLKARIPLVQAKDLNVEQLRVQLASEQAFAARKISRDYLYQSFRYTIELKHPAGPCIVVTTEQPVKEPTLDFLLELSWPSGKLIKGFTVLLDQPGR